MKLVPIALVALSLLVGCSDPTGGGEMVAEEYANRRKRQEGASKNGKGDGLWTYWYARGRKRQEGELKDDKEEGLWTFWKQNGFVDTEKSGIYKAGERIAPLEGWVTTHYPMVLGGQKRLEGEYKNGKQEGRWTEWHHSGQVWSEGEKKNGKREGLWTYWDDFGFIDTRSSGIYKAGKKIAPFEGRETTHYPNGQKGGEGEYKKGKLEGRWTYWRKNGQKYSEGEYKNGKKEGLFTYWFNDGPKKAEGEYKNGKQEGRWTEWHYPKNGQKLSEGEYKNGEKEGRWTLWHDNGQKKQEGEYKNGKEDGLWAYRNEEGKKVLEFEGWARWWVKKHDNGKRKAEGFRNYNGKKEGRWVEWNEDGSIDHEQSGIYKAGKRIAPLPKKK